MKRMLKVTTMLLVVFALTVAFIPYNGTAVIDGNYGEWDLVGTYVGDMHRAGDDLKPVESKLYMMYNWSTITASFLVLTENDPLVYEAVPDDEHWVKVDGTKVPFVIFEYVYDGSDIIGWEASAVIPCGTYPSIYVHTLIDGEDNETSAIDAPLNVDCSLPVELTSFTATNLNGYMVLAWTTESETENLGFILEKKMEGTNWVEIASYKTDDRLLGQGSVTHTTDYEYIDRDIVSGKIYEYRLADVDYNGIVVYHSLTKVLAKYDYKAEFIEYEEQTNVGFFRGCSR